MSLRTVPLFAFLSLAGCAPAAPVAGDASSTPDGSGSPDAAASCELPLPAVPASCAALPSLGGPETRATPRAPGVDTYALSGLAAGPDSGRPSCATDAWHDGGDVSARFTAPRAGVWRVSAHGVGLYALSAQRGCGSSGACAGFGPYAGPFVDAPLSVDLPAERGESFALQLDGCPAGASCRYELRAERIGELSCAPGANPCAAGERCRLLCDGARVQCLPAFSESALDALGAATARAFVDRSTGATYLQGTVAPWPGDAQDALSDYTFYEPLSASGASLGAPRGGATVTMRGGAFGPALGPTVSADTAQLRLWVGYRHSPLGGPGAPNLARAVTVPLEPWSRGAAGAACTPGELPSLCAQQHRCVVAAGSASGRCAQSARLELTAVRGWSSVAEGRLRLELEGGMPGLVVNTATVELLDDAGAPVQAPLSGYTLSLLRDPAEGAFLERFQDDNVPAATLQRARRARVTVHTTDGTTSAPLEGPLAASTANPSGAECVASSAGCGEGLVCEEPETAVARCLPAPAPRVCNLEESAATWAPPASGAFAVRGVPRGFGGFTSCSASRTAQSLALEFVAPTAGRYRFATTGIASLELDTTCAAPLCMRGAADPALEAELTAGQRVPLRALATDGARSFEVRVTVP